MLDLIQVPFRCHRRCRSYVPRPGFLPEPYPEPIPVLIVRSLFGEGECWRLDEFYFHRVGLGAWHIGAEEPFVQGQDLCSWPILSATALPITYLISQQIVRGSRQCSWQNADANALSATAAARSPVAPGIRGVSKSEPVEVDPEVTNASERKVGVRREMRERKRELRRRRQQLTQVNIRKTTYHKL